MCFPQAAVLPPGGVQGEAAGQGLPTPPDPRPVSLQDQLRVPLFLHPSCIYCSTGYNSRIKLTQPCPF